MMDSTSSYCLQNDVSDTTRSAGQDAIDIREGTGRCDFQKGKGKGSKGKRRRYGFFEGDNVIMSNSLAGGKGKKGTGKGNGKRPGGHFVNSLDTSTGSPMKCHECGSIDHLVAQCPKRKGKGKGGGKLKGSAPRFLTNNERQNQQEMILQGMFVAQDHWFINEPAGQSSSSHGQWDRRLVGALRPLCETLQDTHFDSSVRIYELDNDDESNSNDEDDEITPERKPALWNFPWWRIGSTEEASDSYLVKTRMKGREGEALLIDPGSPDNLCGDEWSERMRIAAVQAGRPTTTSSPMRNPLEVGGVGIGT